MGKKNRTYEVKTINLGGGTILEQFLRYMKTHRKVSDIIGFLAVKNAEMLFYQNPLDVSEGLKKELIDFYNYFMDEYGAVTEIARMENWGEDDALTLRMGSYFLYEKEQESQKAYMSSLPPLVKQEGEKLMETIFDIRQSKNVTILCADYVDTFHFPKTIPKKELKDAKQEFLFSCCQMVDRIGSMVVRLFESDGTYRVFGIRVFDNKIWSPVSKEEMEAASLMTPSGERLEPEEGVVYTEIIRERV